MPFFGQEWRLKVEKEVLKEKTFAKEIVAIIRSGLKKEELRERLGDYHSMLWMKMKSTAVSST